MNDNDLLRARPARESVPAPEPESAEAGAGALKAKYCAHVWKEFARIQLPGHDRVFVDRCVKPWCSLLLAYTLKPILSRTGLMRLDRLPVRIEERALRLLKEKLVENPEALDDESANGNSIDEEYKPS